MKGARFTLGVHRWSFPACTLREAASIAIALGFDFLDLGNSADHSPARIAADPEAEAELLLKELAPTPVPLRDAFLHFDPKFSTNHPDLDVRSRNLQVARGYLDFARRVGLSGITVSPGVAWQDESPEAAADRSADALRELLALGNERGVAVRIEPHIGSVAETPNATLDLLERVPGLSLTLDYSHFFANGFRQQDLESLRPHAGHWHLRQAGAGRGQQRFDEGEIDVPSLVDWWRTSEYDGGVCLEYVHSPWMELDRVDCLTETVKLRDQLRHLRVAAEAIER